VQDREETVAALPIRLLAAGAILALGAGAARADFKAAGRSRHHTAAARGNEAELHAATKLVEQCRQEAMR
jgi:hypothetical protein